jgi:vacuolar-type H+-ATPase subunit C/Vma6
MIAEVGSLNARVGGRKAALLAPAVMESLLEAESLPGIFTLLRGTRYGPDLDRATLRFKGIEAIERALAWNFSASCRSLIAAAAPSLRPVVSALLSEWDLRNVLALLRALHGGRPAEETEPFFVAAGTLDEPALRELLAQGGVAEACALLATWGLPWAGALTDALPRYRASGRIAGLELATVSGITGEALAAVRGPGIDRALAREAIGRRIDAAIIIAKLRSIDDGLPIPGATRFRSRERRREVSLRARRIARARRARERAAGSSRVTPVHPRASREGVAAGTRPSPRAPRPPAFPNGGADFSGQRLALLLAVPDQQSFVRLLSGTFYAGALGREMVDLGTVLDAAVLERNLEELLLERFGMRFTLANPGTIAPLIAWLWSSWAEVVNLRIAVRGMVYGMPREAIRAEWYRVP